MRHIVIVLVLVAVLPMACKKGNRVVKREGEPDYVVSKNNALMDRAKRKAQDTYRELITALQNPKPTMDGFAVKKPFRAGGGFEHIWVGEVRWDGSAFTGTVNNEPVDTKEVRFGQTVTVRPDEISDWMYIDNGTLKGGYTIRALYHEASAKEKRDLDKQLPFKVPAVDF